MNIYIYISVVVGSAISCLGCLFAKMDTHLVPVWPVYHNDLLKDLRLLHIHLPDLIIEIRLLTANMLSYLQYI